MLWGSQLLPILILAHQNFGSSSIHYEGQPYQADKKKIIFALPREVFKFHNIAFPEKNSDPKTSPNMDPNAAHYCRK